MKKMRVIIVAMAIGLLTASVFTTPAEAGTKRIKLGHTLSETSTWHLAALEFGEKIKERTGGRFVVDVFANEQLSSGNQQKAIEMLQTGMVDADIKSTIILSAFEPKLSVINLPWVMPTPEQADAIRNGDGGKMIFDLLRKKNMIPLGIGETGYRQVINNKRQLLTPQDFSGLKIRVPGMTLYVDLFSLLGSDPTVMNFSEVFTALQQNTIDGMEGVVDVVVTSRFYEVQKFMTLNNYSIDLCVLSLSPRFYNSLSPEDKTIFEDTAREVMDNQVKLARETDIKSLEFLKTKMDVQALDNNQIEVFKKTVTPLYEKFKEQYGAELMAAFGYSG